MTALSLVEEQDLDALTMRRVAAALHVTPMSLYNHVSDKAELVDLMVDFLLGDVVAKSLGDDGDWEAKIRAHARRNHEMWWGHPGLVRVYTEGVTMGPNGLANCEYTIGVLRDAGFSDEDAGRAFMLLYRLTVATLLVAPARPVDRNHLPAPAPRLAKEEQLRAYFSALPLEAIPNVVATATYLRGTSIDFGLDIVIAGLKARLGATDCTEAKTTDTALDGTIEADEAT